MNFSNSQSLASTAIGLMKQGCAEIERILNEFTIQLPLILLGYCCWVIFQKHLLLLFFYVLEPAAILMAIHCLLRNCLKVSAPVSLIISGAMGAFGLLLLLGLFHKDANYTLPFSWRHYPSLWQ